MTMFNLGDRVKHLDTGTIGIVIGFGKRIVDNQCLPTVKVKITTPESSKKNTIKDLNIKWINCSEDYRLLYPNSASKNLILKPIKRYDRAKIA